MNTPHDNNMGMRREENRRGHCVLFNLMNIYTGGQLQSWRAAVWAGFWSSPAQTLYSNNQLICGLLLLDHNYLHEVCWGQTSAHIVPLWAHH